jgi:hypothetical protein
VIVDPVNDAPVGADTAFATGQNKPLAGILPRATDVDGDMIGYGVGSQPGNGTVAVRPTVPLSLRRTLDSAAMTASAIR